MSHVQTALQFLDEIPLYDQEKPYFALPLQGSGIDPDKHKITNIKLVEHPVRILDCRGEDFSVARNGFCVANHASQTLPVNDLAGVKAYKAETEKFLHTVFPDAEKILTWDFRHRKNIAFTRTEFDSNDPLLIEGPAKGAHNATVDSGPDMISQHLPHDDQQRYVKPGYRFRMINTWRSLVPKLEDRPLAVCDFQTIQPNDLMPADRVYPQVVGEIYYLLNRSYHQWYWLSDQTPEEVFVMIMFDSSAPKSNAKYCPHVSFDNPLASPDAPFRQSIETRSIIISRI